MLYFQCGKDVTTWWCLGLCIQYQHQFDKVFFGWITCGYMEESKGKILTGDLLRILDLQQELASIKQGDTSIIDYFTKLRVIGDELENYRPEPICTCATKKMLL